MQCSACGTRVLPGKPFCHVCGNPTAPGCAQCGARLEAGFRFCPDCGAAVPQPEVESRLGSAAPASPPPQLAVATVSPTESAIPETLAQKIRAQRGAIEGERKLVTVVFCDLVGSTAIAEKLDPEVYRELLDEYVALAFHEVYRFEGIVNQLSGDGLMALFGAPIAHEDAPQRAVWAALAILSALDKLSRRVRDERGIEMRARVGIHTGPVVVGTVGNDLKMDYTAIGDTTNLAARLQALAAPGTVLVSEATFGLVRGFFEMRPAGPFDVKGKSAPVPAYQALRGRPVAHKFAIATERGLTPLVGREQELAQMQGCFDRAAEHLPQVLEVVGETGSGRSRLVYEFKQRLASSAVVFEARCAALNQRTAYFPWVSMLHRYFGVVASESAETTTARVAAKLATLGLEDERNLHALLHLFSPTAEDGGDLPADDIKRETFEAIGRIFFAENQTKPVVVIVEDLHWIDEPSREMLERAIAELCRTRLMFVLTHRPEIRPQWQTQAAVTWINLRRLSDTAAREIIRTVATGEVPPELEQLILKKSEGSPFFTEEITRSLLEGGYLERSDGQHRLTRPVDEISIPGTVQEVIAARLDRLPADAKRALQVAAVLGRQFSRAQLGDLVAGETLDLERALGELEARGIVHRKNLFTNDLYRFGESLTQEVAYEGLLLRQRRQLHERIGMMLEALPAERSAERSALLAHHFVNSENYERAAAALLQAAAECEKVPSYRAAARFYRDAWELLRRDGRSLDGPLANRAVDSALGLARMAVFYNASPVAETEPICELGERLAEKIGQRETQLSLRAYRGMLLVNGGRERFYPGLALVEETLEVARAWGVAMPGLARGAAWAYAMDGRFVLARQTIDAALEQLAAAPRFRHSDVYVGGMYLRDRIAYFADDFEGARRTATATHELAVQASNRTVQGGTAATLAMIHLWRAEYSEARRWADRAVDLARITGSQSARLTEAAIAIVCKVALGEARGGAKFVESIDEAAIEGDLLMCPWVVVAALVALGELDRAVAFAHRVHEHASGRLRQMYAAVALADALRFHDSGASDKAMAYYAEAIALADVIGCRSGEALARLGLAEIQIARDDRNAAQPNLVRVIQICRELSTFRLLPQATDLLDPSGSDRSSTRQSA